MKIYITAIVSIKPDFREEVLQVLKNMVQKTQEEGGCELYRLHQNNEDENTFIFYEIWKNEAALSAHNQQPYILEFVALVAEKLQKKPEILKMSLVQ